jgi:hypothetical protein
LIKTYVGNDQIWDEAFNSNIQLAKTIPLSTCPG